MSQEVATNQGFLEKYGWHVAFGVSLVLFLATIFISSNPEWSWVFLPGLCTGLVKVMDWM